MEKRLAYFARMDERGRYIIETISPPMDVEKALEHNPHYGDKQTSAWIDVDYEPPGDSIGKIRTLYFHPDSEVLEVEYRETRFEEMTLSEKVELLSIENKNLRNELNLTQSALFELHAQILSGGVDNG